MQAPKLHGDYGISSAINIKASQEKVWEVLKDFTNVYTWAPSVTESHSLNNKKLGVGHGRHCKLDGFGEIDEHITIFEEGQGFVYDVTPLGPLDQAFSSWWLTTNSDQTTRLEVVFSYKIRFGLFGKMMHKLVMRGKLEASFPEGLKAFKNRVETGKLVRPYLKEMAAA